MSMIIKSETKGGPLIKTDICSIDADIIAHKVANASDGKFYIYQGEEHTLISDIKKAHPDYNRADVGTAYEPEEWKDVEGSLKSMVSTIKWDIKADDYLFFLSRGSTFRHKLATILPYKGNRKDVHVPHWLNDCKEFIVSEWGGEYGDGVEADDLMHRGSVLASIDKDLLTIPKIHYNLDKRSIQEVSPIDAYRNFYCQMLVGDSTDNILGLYKVGPKSTYCKKVCACGSVKDMHEVVYSAYKERFGSYTKQFFLENAKLVWILQDDTPYFEEVMDAHRKRKP